MTEKLPIAYARRQGSNLVVDHCPLCGDTHYHGLGDGPRLAHCGVEDRRRAATSSTPAEYLVQSTPITPARAAPATEDEPMSTDYQYRADLRHLVEFARETLEPPPGWGRELVELLNFEFGPDGHHLFAWQYLRSDRLLLVHQRGRWFAMPGLAPADIGKAISDNLEDMPDYGGNAEGLGIMSEIIAESQQQLRESQREGELCKYH